MSKKSGGGQKKAGGGQKKAGPKSIIFVVLILVIWFDFVAL